MLAEGQRIALVAFLEQTTAANFSMPVLLPQVPQLSITLSEAFSDDEALVVLLKEAKTWAQHWRMAGYWLTACCQQVTAMRKSPLHPWACMNWAHAQLAHGHEDLGIDSLERAYVLAKQVTGDSVPSVGPSALEIALRLVSLHGLYTRSARSHNYQDANPVADNSYVCLTWLDFEATTLPPESQKRPPSADALLAVIDQNGGEEGAWARVVARRHLGYLAAAQDDLAGAVNHYSTALEEARAALIDAEVGHLLRSLGHTFALSGHLDAAIKAFSLALVHDNHPLPAYWHALDYRMLGTAWARANNKGDDGALAKSNEAYNEGRSLLQAHFNLSTFLPISRVNIVQLMRSSIDDALQAAAFLVERDGYPSHIGDLLGEVEMTAPTGALEALEEAQSVRRQTAPTQQSKSGDGTFLQDREVFLRWFRHGDESSISYLAALPGERAARGRYVQARLRWEEGWPQLSVEQAVAKYRAMADDTHLSLHFVVGDSHLWFALVDEHHQQLVFDAVPVAEADLRAAHERYRAATPSPQLLLRGEGLPEAEAALDGLLAVYAGCLAEVLEKALPHLEGKRVKVYPRALLNQVPWSALPVGTGCLIDHCDVSYGQSMAMVARAHEAFGGRPVATGMNVVMGQGVLLYEALFSQLGVGPVLRDPTLTALGGALARAKGQLFFACHGRYEPDEPANSTLEFGPQGRTTFSELLGRLDLSDVDCVVLGACESAAGRSEVSSEFIGLSNAFLAAGARYVMGALWRVNQLATTVMLERYVGHVAELGVPGALNQAQRDLKTMTRQDVCAWVGRALPDMAVAMGNVISRLPDPPFAHPRLWAGFTVQGDL
jgi:tetratricopeptide (TPR) repeat protein